MYAIIIPNNLDQWLITCYCNVLVKPRTYEYKLIINLLPIQSFDELEKIPYRWLGSPSNI